MKDSNPAHALTAPHPADPARPGAATWASERLPTSRSARRELQPLLTLPEVAVLLRLSEKTIRRLLAARRLPCVRPALAGAGGVGSPRGVGKSVLVGWWRRGACLVCASGGSLDSFSRTLCGGFRRGRRAERHAEATEEHGSKAESIGVSLPAEAWRQDHLDCPG